jgi:ABC-2 type transport system permease protein
MAVRAITAVPTEAPLRHLVRAYLCEAKYETLRMLRMPAFAGPFLVIPIAMYLFFGLLGPGANAEATRPQNLPPGPYFLTGFTVMGIMGPALFGFGMGLALEREQGLLQLKRAMPMPKGAYLAAKMLMSIIFAALVAGELAIASAFAGRIPLTIGQAASVIVVAMLGTFPFAAIGLFIGARVSGRAAPAFVNLAYIPLMYLSGLFFPIPQSIRWLAMFSPAFHLNQLALHVAGTPSILGPAINVAALIGVTVLFTGLTVRRLIRA